MSNREFSQKTGPTQKTRDSRYTRYGGDQAESVTDLISAAFDSLMALTKIMVPTEEILADEAESMPPSAPPGTLGPDEGWVHAQICPLPQGWPDDCAAVGVRILRGPYAGRRTGISLGSAPHDRLIAIAGGGTTIASGTVVMVTVEPFTLNGGVLLGVDISDLRAWPSGPEGAGVEK